MAERYRVDEATGCWLWTGYRNKDGYGVLTAGGIQHKAHRYFYEQRNGRLPDGLELDHTCRNRACVNPEHLEPVTHAENIRRGRSTPLTSEGVWWIRRLRQSGIKQREIAEIVGVTIDSVKNVLTGRTWAGA